MTKLRVQSFTAFIPAPGQEQRIPTYGSGKRPQSDLEALAKQEPNSYIRVVKPQFLDPAIEQGTDQFYDASKSHLDQLIQSESLLTLTDAMFLYEQQQPGIAPLRGIVLAVGAENCADGSVKKHENVLQSKAGRLVKHIAVLKSISEPVLLTQKLPESIKSWLHEPRETVALVENTDVFGFVHRIWLLSEEEQQRIVEGFGGLDSLYIADGHHRVAGVSQYLTESGNPGNHGLMSLVMDQDDLLIKSFHRVIKGFDACDIESYLKDNGVEYRKVVDLSSNPLPEKNQAMAITAEGSYIFSLGEVRAEDNAVEQLEVSRVESGIIKSVFGIENTSNDPRISFMRGDTPLVQMESMIAQGDCCCVFVLPANSFQQVEAVADQQLTMPPKSTWVEPKLLTGFLSQRFD